MQDTTEVLSKLNYLQNKFMKVVDTVDKENLDTTIQENKDGWTTIEILRHIPLAEAEIIELIEEVISGSTGVAEDFDIDEQNAKYREQYEDMTVDQIKQHMSRTREKTLEFLKNSSKDTWEKKGTYLNGQEMTVTRMFEILMWHQNHHLKQIIEKLELEI